MKTTKLEQLKDKFCDLADQEFPKGDKARGKAMVLVALCLQEVEQLIREERAEELEWALESSGGGEWRRRIIVRLAQLDAEEKKFEKIDKAMDKVFEDYGETLRLLGEKNEDEQDR